MASLNMITKRGEGGRGRKGEGERERERKGGGGREGEEGVREGEGEVYITTHPEGTPPLHTLRVH